MATKSNLCSLNTIPLQPYLCVTLYLEGEEAGEEEEDDGDEHDDDLAPRTDHGGALRRRRRDLLYKENLHK